MTARAISPSLPCRQCTRSPRFRPVLEWMGTDLCAIPPRMGHKMAPDGPCGERRRIPHSQSCAAVDAAQNATQAVEEVVSYNLRRPARDASVTVQAIDIVDVCFRDQPCDAKSDAHVPARQTRAGL